MKYKVFFKRILLVLILVCMTFMATACDFDFPDDNDYVYTPTPPRVVTPRNPFPEIPVHKQTKKLTAEQIWGSTFFSSKNGYFNIRKDMRYVSLHEHKTVYIKYEKKLDKDVKKELDEVVKYLRNILTTINPGYKLVYEQGEPAGLLDVFCYDTVYVKNPDKETLNRFKNDRIGGIAYLYAIRSPVIHVNKDVCDVIVNGKNIKLALILLHEIMHGFGFKHTEGLRDLMGAIITPIKQYYSRYYYQEPGTRNRVYIDDYIFFSNDEKAALVQYLVPKKSFSEKANLYRKIGGTNDLEIKFEKMESEFLSNTIKKSVIYKSPDILSEDQIISMIDKTKTYEITLNDTAIGSYTYKHSDGTSFKGRSKIIDVPDSRLTNQIIVLTDFAYNGTKQDITLYTIRDRDGKFYQRWKVYDENIDLLFADNTANYFS